MEENRQRRPVTHTRSHDPGDSTRESEPSRAKLQKHRPSSNCNCSELFVPLAAAIFTFFGVFCALAYLFTGSTTGGLVVWPVKTSSEASLSPLRSFTLAQLAEYDGTDPSKPIYLSIMGRVFDVSAGRRFYGPGGGYHAFAGKDNSRGFHSGCFSHPQNHDLRGLSSDQLQEIEGWVKFYEKHETYFEVGWLMIDIDPSSPLPDDVCDK